MTHAATSKNTPKIRTTITGNTKDKQKAPQNRISRGLVSILFYDRFRVLVVNRLPQIETIFRSDLKPNCGALLRISSAT